MRGTRPRGQHVGREVVLQLGALVQVVEHYLGHGVALEHDHQALAGAPGSLVADVGDAAHVPVAHQLGDLVRKVVGVDLIGQLGDHQALAALDLLDVDHGPLSDRAAPGAVGVLDAATPQNGGAGGEIGAGDALDESLQQLFAAGLGMCEEPLDSGGDLTQVVRRDAGGHAHRDALRTVDQEIREAGRQDNRLLVAPVVVVLEIDALLIDVADHLHGQGGPSCTRCDRGAAGPRLPGVPKFPCPATSG